MYDEFTKPRKTDTPVAQREKQRMRDLLSGKPVETKEASYLNLKLHVRWGRL